MTQEELKDKMSKGFADMKPIIDQITNLLMDAYEKGLEVGMELGKHFTIKED